MNKCNRITTTTADDTNPTTVIQQQNLNDFEQSSRNLKHL